MMRLWNAIRKRFPKAELLAALCAAGWFYARQNGLIALCQRAGNLWHTLWLGQEVSDELAEKRMAVCRKCIIFFEPLSTCGTPLHGNRHMANGKQIGCWCHMPTKARHKENCWFYDLVKGDLMPYEPSWPKELNSWPYE